MPITVNCQCGKIFKVKDDAAGTVVQCQICGKQIAVPAQAPVHAGVAAGPPPVPPLSAPLPSAFAPPVLRAGAPVLTPNAPATEKIPCPVCAEEIEADSSFCPFCGEKLAPTLSPEKRQALIDERVALLDQHLSDPKSLDMDQKIRGGKYSTSTIVIGIIEAASLLSLIAGIVLGHSGEPFAVMGTVGLMFMTIPIIVSLVNNASANNIQESKDPAAAYKKYAKAIKTGRYNKAFCALIPSGRKFGPVQSITFKNPKIPPHKGKYVVRDATGFNKYWKSIFAGPSGNSRTVTLKKVNTVTTGDTTAVVEAEYQITSYPQALILLILINLIVVCIAILVVQKKETQKIRKLMIKRGGKWFIAEGEFQGRMDTVV